MSADSLSFLFLCRRPPFGRDRFSGMLDMLLTASAFDQNIRLIFSGAGVLNLLAGGDAGAIGLKNSGKALSALDMYGVEDVYVEAGALELYGLSRDDLLVPATTISHAELALHLHNADQVIIS